MRKLNPDMVRWIFMSLMIILFIVTGISGLDWQYSLTGAVGFTWIIFEMMMLNQIGRSIHGMLAYLMRPIPQQNNHIPDSYQKKIDHESTQLLDRTKQLINQYPTLTPEQKIVLRGNLRSDQRAVLSA